MPTRWDRIVLYEIVWLRPMGHLSRCFRENSAKIRTECRRLNVPIPTMSYWAALRAGTCPPKTPLPNDDSPPGEGYVLLEEEVARLTGQTDKNQLQDKLRLMEIPFAVNAAGMPLVPFEAVTGNAEHAATAAAVLSKRLKAMYALIGVKIENY